MNGTGSAGAMLAAQLDRMLRQSVDARLLHAIETGGGDRGLGARVAELGLSHALLPEALGGAGLGWAEVGGVFETLGAHAAPVPLGEAMLALWAMGRAGLPCDAPAPALSAGSLAASPGARGVSGHCTVPWGAQSGCVLAPAQDGGAHWLCLLATADATSDPVASIGRTPTVRLRFAAAAPLAVAAVTGDGGLAEGLAMLRAAQIAGALGRVLGLAIDYGNTRSQFGRPIGKFQAVQHMIAELASEAAAAKAGVQLALRALDASPDVAGDAVAVAKIRASLAAGKAAAIAHQVFGAIGVTEEHVLHYFTRRLWQWRDDAGNEHVWSERLGRAALARGEAALWPSIVALSGTEPLRGAAEAPTPGTAAR